MAKPNYKRQKDQKDQARKRKQDEKAQRKAERAREGSGEGIPDQPADEEQAPGGPDETSQGI